MPKIKEPTTRQMEVIKLACKGLSNREIAKKLKLCERTIKTYNYDIYKKYGIKRRIQLYLLAEKE